MENNAFFTDKEISLLADISKTSKEMACMLILLPNNNINSTKHFVEEPIENMPMYLNSTYKAYSIIAKWRLKIGK